MDGLTGMSIFDGGEFVPVGNNAALDAMEAEAAADNKRLMAELHQNLGEMFDNYSMSSDSDDDLSNISGGRKSFNNVKPSQNGDQNSINHRKHHHHAGKDDALKNRDFEIATLRNQLESKCREFEHVSSLLAEERKTTESRISEMEHRLTISEADRDRAKAKNQQTHELLVESKVELSNLSDEVERLKQKNRTIETTNSELQAQLESSKVMLSDLQQKYHMVERNVGFTNDRNTDALVKATNERYSGKIDLMQQQIDTLRIKYDEKVAELKNLEIRYHELQRSREGMLIEKSETINQLAQSLEESQRRCQQLMEKPDLTQENIRLERLAAVLERQINEMQATINTLTMKLEKTTAELDIMDSVLCDADLSESVRRLSLNSRHKSKNLSAEDRLAKLNGELYRCIDSLKQKRDEIKKLEKKLEEKNDEIRRGKNDEFKSKTELNLMREKAVEMERKLKCVEQELDSVKSNNTERTEINTLTVKYEEQLTAHKELTGELENAHSRIKSLEKLIEVSESKYNDLRKMNTMEKESVESLKKIAAAENHRIDETTQQLENLCKDYQTEIGELKVEVDRLRMHIDELNEKLDLKNQRDTLIDDLKLKAQRFEEFLQNSTQNNSPSASQSVTSIKPKSRDQSVSTSPDLIHKSSRETEERLRNEFAKSFAVQLKTVESKNQTKVQQYEKGVELLKNQLAEVCGKYDQKIAEMNVLKCVILAERDKSSDLLKEKDSELKRFLTEYQKVLKHFQDQFDTYEKNIEQLQSTVKQKDERIAENHSTMKRLMTQFTKERDELIKAEATMRTELAKLDVEKKEALKEVKKISAKCKQWSDAKEKHVQNECKRIRESYESALETIKSRVRVFLKNQQKLSDEELTQFETEYSEKFKFV